MKLPKLPIKFYRKQEVSVPNDHKRIKRFLTVSRIFFYLALLTWTVYTTMTYFTNYSWKWQSPIIIKFQTPLLIEHKVSPMVSPMSTHSATLVKQVYADAPTDVKSILKEKVIEKWGTDQWQSMDYLISRESGYNLKAVNASSGACGMGQSLPCSKLINKCPNFNDADCQAQWVVDYVADRYNTPFLAAVHEAQENWY